MYVNPPTLVHISNLPSEVQIQYPVNLERPTPDDVAPNIAQWTEAAKTAIQTQVMPSFRTHGYRLQYVRTEETAQHLNTVYNVVPIDQMNAMWIGSRLAST